MEQQSRKFSGVESLAWAGQSRELEVASTSASDSTSTSGLDGDSHVPNHPRASTLRAPSPQWSIATVRSLDISSHIPGTAFRMDAEDSPWGGTSIMPLQQHSTLTLIFKMFHHARARAQISTKLQRPKIRVSRQSSCDLSLLIEFHK